MRDFFSTAQIGKINKTYINKDLYLYNIDLVINNILQIYLHFEPSAKNTTLIFFLYILETISMIFLEVATLILKKIPELNGRSHEIMWQYIHKET